MKKILVIIIIVLLLAAGFWLVRQRKNTTIDTKSSSQAATTPTATQQVSVTTKTITDASASIRYKINVQYPQVSGLSNATAQQTINSDVSSLAASLVSKFKDEVNTSDQPKNGTAINALNVKYSTASANNALVSFVFDVEDAQVLAAHPNHYLLTYNYSVNQNKKLQLSDLFTPGSNYLTTISTIAKKQLADKEKQNPNASDLINQGAAPKAANFQLFTIGSNGLTIYFNPATVAPDYFGPMQVSVPFADVSSVINSSLFK